MSGLRAELIADGGEGASSSGDFFRSPEFLGAEGVGHTLVVSGGDTGIAVPLIVREIPGSDRRDAISPYGYPGAQFTDQKSAPPPADVDWSGAGLVSLFLRDRVGDPPAFSEPAERSAIQMHHPSQPRRVRDRLAEQIRGNERAGWTVQRTSGPEASRAQRTAFASAYAETMRRVGAAERYLYPEAYFERILGFEGSHLLLASEAATHGAGALAVVSDGVLHYYLGGTADAAIEASPFKNVVAAMLDLADELDLRLNLGGGIEPGDGLERFKRGFANAAAPFRTHEVVADPAAYAELSGDREAPGFFPAYRAPG